MTLIAGQLVTEAFGYDDGRPVTVYILPDSPQGIVFAGDGQLISQWGGVLEAAEVPPTMTVGVTGWTTRRCGSGSTHQASNRSGSLLTSGSSSSTSAGGCGRALESRCLPHVVAAEERCVDFHARGFLIVQFVANDK